MARRVLVLTVLAVYTVAGLQHAHKGQAAAAVPDSCGLRNDPRFTLNTTCNGSCRTAIHGALVNIYTNLNGHNWTWGSLEDHIEDAPAAAKWRPDSSTCLACTMDAGEPAPFYCCWEGVICCGEHHNYADEDDAVSCQPYSVSLLQLRDGNIAGNLSSIMEQLQVLHAAGLTYLDLSRNYLTSSIPTAFGSLDKLRVLMLGSNYLTGTVPAGFGELNRLKLLDLEFNFLSGRLSPQQLCPAGNVLQAAYLRANNFTGSLNMTACRRLEIADIQENGFVGPLPVGQQNRQLKVLRARLNGFSGTISLRIWELPQLMLFDVTNNSLSGSLPQRVAPSVFLTSLSLGSNNLSGRVPAGITQSTQLSKLDLSDNFMLTGTLPDMMWMQGLQELSISNTLISGTIPQSLAQLPYLESVDMHNTLMTCCRSWQEAQAPQPPLLPAFLAFDESNQVSPASQMLGRDPLLNAYMNTGQNMLCQSVRRSPDYQTASTTTVLRPANLSRQSWIVDPEYYWFQQCQCISGYNPHWVDGAAAVWCNPSLHAPNAAAASSCVPMRVLTCVPKPRLAKEEIAGVAVGAVALLLLLLMLASLSVNMFMARYSKIRRQLHWWHKHLAGMPRSGKMAIVVTDIEGYSDLFKRCPELMYRALTLHNNVIRRAKYGNCGSTVQQEGDSYTLAFHDANDAVAFCLQAQLALMQVHWPEGLMEADSSVHMRTASKGSRRSKLPPLDSLLAGGANGWLRKARPTIKAGSSVGMQAQPADSLQAPSSAAAASAAGTSVLGGRAGSRSKSRMLDYFRGQQGAAASAGLFNGLRVRMGVVTGVVEGPAEAGAALANIMNSSLYKLALDVSDAGNGGQVLMDDATFARIKEELHPLGAVDANGLNYGKLSARTSLWQLLCLGALCSSRCGSRHDTLDADEAVVLDMGQYEAPTLPQKVANTSLRNSLKSVWPQALHHTHAAGNAPAGSPAGDAAAAAAAAAEGYLLQATSPLPCAMPLVGSSNAYSSQQRVSAGGGDGSSGAAGQRQRVRLVQILAPSLVGRAAVWGNQLALKSNWVCTDAPYFEAPGALEAPLGNTYVSRSTSSGAHTASAAVASTLPHLHLDAPAALGSAGLGLPAALTLGAASSVTTDDISAAAGLPSKDIEQRPQLGQHAGATTTPAATAAGVAGSSVSSSWQHHQQQHCDPQPPSPVPAVTMVFLVVEGAKVFGKGRRTLVKEVHAALSQLLVEALRHVRGGYLCRMQEGDLKYMVAFGSARSALEWCLLVQEAALYLNWPDKSFARIPQLRSEYDAEGQLVFRGPRLKMGVCKGVPRTIIPDHLGRADYHGSSINQAARYMDAGAHGGQIACEAELAAAVFSHWAQGGSSGDASPGCSSSSVADDAYSVDSGVVDSGAESAVGRTVSAPAATSTALAGAAALAAAGGGGGGGPDGLGDARGLQMPHGRLGQRGPLSAAGSHVELADCTGVGAGGPLVQRSSASRSSESELAQMRSTGSQAAQQQQQHCGILQQQEGAAADDGRCRCTCSSGCAEAGACERSTTCSTGAAAAAPAPAGAAIVEAAGAETASVGSSAATPSTLATPFAMPADTAGAAASAAAGMPSGSAGASTAYGAAASVMPPALSGQDSTSSGQDSSAAAAAAAAGNSSGLGRRLLNLFDKSSAARGKLGNSDAHIRQRELQLSEANDQNAAVAAAAGAGKPLPGQAVHAAAAAPPPPVSAASRFGLAEVPRLPVQVHAHHIGSFRFKGNPQPLQMVNVMAAGLAGRAALFPADPPRGKGNRVAAAAGLAGSAVAPLPTLALQYRARVPPDLLERTAATPLAAAAAVAADPSRLLMDQLRTASMPAPRSRTMLAGLRWGGASPFGDAARRHPQQQQQAQLDNDLEQGFGFGAGMLRLPSSRASSARSLSFLLQQRRTPSIPEEAAGWGVAAAGKDAAETAVGESDKHAHVPSDAGTHAADVRCSSSSSGSSGWATGVAGLLAPGGSYSSKVQLSQSLRSKSDTVSSSSSGFNSAGARTIGGSGRSAFVALGQSAQRPVGAEVSKSEAVPQEQHSAALSAAGRVAGAAAGAAAGLAKSRA